jgi:hypothetical protein
LATDSSACAPSFLFAFTLYLQSGLDDSPLRSGLTFAPFAAGFALTSLTHTKLPRRTRRWAPLVGLCVLGGGYASLGVLDGSGNWHAGTSALLLALAGAGFGAGFSPMIARTVAPVPRRLTPDASGTVSMTVNLGFVTGVAPLGTCYLDRAHAGPAPSGRAFSNTSLLMAALAAVAALLASP